MTMSSRVRCWLLVVVFAIGMAFVESATVYDLRVMVDRIDPYQPNPLPMRATVGNVELAREAATMVMLFAVGAIAGRTSQTRLGYTAIAFGVWDIFYYVFLEIICGWPASIFDWDILFLLPLPWWGPVLAPVCIAVLMIACGTLVTLGRGSNPLASASWSAWRLNWAGVALALYVFMADSLRAAIQGADVTRVLPATFNWPAFAVALVLMAAPILWTIAGYGWRGIVRLPSTSGGKSFTSS